MNTILPLAQTKLIRWHALALHRSYDANVTNTQWKSIATSLAFLSSSHSILFFINFSFLNAYLFSSHLSCCSPSYLIYFSFSFFSQCLTFNLCSILFLFIKSFFFWTLFFFIVCFLLFSLMLMFLLFESECIISSLPSFFFLPTHFLFSLFLSILSFLVFFLYCLFYFFLFLDAFSPFPSLSFSSFLLSWCSLLDSTYFFFIFNASFL